MKSTRSYQRYITKYFSPLCKEENKGIGPNFVKWKFQRRDRQKFVRFLLQKWKCHKASTKYAILFLYFSLFKTSKFFVKQRHCNVCYTGKYLLNFSVFFDIYLKKFLRLTIFREYFPLSPSNSLQDLRSCLKAHTISFLVITYFLYFTETIFWPLRTLDI